MAVFSRALFIATTLSLTKERMITDPTIIESESLGTYLHTQRTKRKFEIEDIEDDTKIPARTLRAMEADDYVSLPAEAFARGFYSLYAKSLGLDVEHVLERYTQERGFPPVNTYTAPPPPPKHEKTVNTLAARPLVSLSSFLGFSLVIAIIAFAAICYYFSWNPATYISDRLRSFQKSPAVEQPDEEPPPSPEKSQLKKETLSSENNRQKARRSPLVVMSGSKNSHYTTKGIVFITVPQPETLKN